MIMRRNRPENIVLWLLVGILVISLPFCFKLLLVEYVRLFILGTALALVCVTFPRAFQDSYYRMCFLAGAYAYTLWLLDPAVNGVAFFGQGAKAFNTYRILSLLILLAATVVWVFPLVTRKEAFAGFMSRFTQADGYVLVGICCVGLMFTVMESVRAMKGGGGLADGLMRGTKFIDCALAYLLVVRCSQSNATAERRRVYTLAISFLAFCVFASLVGAGRAAAAYHVARIPPKMDVSKGLERRNKLKTLRENLLRVFSLNSREALIVYEAGYRAGREEWEASLKQLEKKSPFPRLGVEEAALTAELASGRHREAVRRLEAMPASYIVGTYPSQQFVTTVLDILRNASVKPEMYYLAGLMAMHTGRNDEMEKYMTEFLSSAPNHANATYFLNKGVVRRLRAFSLFEMPARGWLEPRSIEKAVEEGDNHITIVYNQHVEGTLWLLPGKYEVTVWARDDGTTLDNARASGFDPTCKARVWIGRTFYGLRVLSTNRTFCAYTFDTNIEKPPTDVVIEFTNDTYDQSRGWDRNLSISRIEFRRKKKK